MHKFNSVVDNKFNIYYPSYSVEANELKDFGYWIDSFCLLGVMLSIVGNIFIINYYSLPLPILFSIPIFRHLERPKNIQRSLKVLFKPWFINIFLFYFLYTVAARSMDQIVYLVSSAILLIDIVLFVRDKNDRMNEIIYILILSLAISSFVFLLRAYKFELGDQIYFFLFEHNSESIIPSGLTNSLHLFGYQVAAFVPLAFAGFFMNGSKKKRLIFLGLVILSVTSLVLSGQRSAAAASLVSIIILWLVVSLKKKFLILISTILSLLWLPKLVATGSLSLSLKIQMMNDYQWRAELQSRAIDYILANPLGMYISGGKWDISDITSKQITAHNAYLVHILNMGWIAGIWMFIVLLSTTIILIKHIRTHRNGKYTSDSLRIGIALAMVALFINALFHNSSLFILNGTSWAIYIIVWYSLDLDLRSKSDRRSVNYEYRSITHEFRSQ